MTDFAQSTTSESSGNHEFTAVENFVQATESLKGSPPYRSAKESEVSVGIESHASRAPNEKSREALRQLRKGDLNEHESVAALRDELT
jgi:hypothetical protein